MSRFGISLYQWHEVQLLKAVVLPEGLPLCSGRRWPTEVVDPHRRERHPRI